MTISRRSILGIGAGAIAVGVTGATFIHAEPVKALPGAGGMLTSNNIGGFHVTIPAGQGSCSHSYRKQDGKGGYVWVSGRTIGQEPS